MSTSSRTNVINSIVSAVQASTGVKTCTRDEITWWQLPEYKFPFVWVRDRETSIEQVAFASTSLMYKEAAMQVTATCFVFDRAGKTETKRGAVLAAVEKAVAQSTALRALIVSIDPVRIVTDNETLENYSIGTVEFRVVYHYNHLAP